MGQLDDRLKSLGADATIRLDQPKPDLIEAFAREAHDNSVDVVIDYLWAGPTEAFIQAITRKGLSHVVRPVRLVEVGDSAGKTINLPAAILRSSGLEICGSGAGSVPTDEVVKRVPEFFELAAKAEFRIEIEKAPLERVEEMWQREFHGLVAVRRYFQWSEGGRTRYGYSKHSSRPIAHCTALAEDEVLRLQLGLRDWFRLME